MISPHVSHVAESAPSAGQVTAYGPGLSHGIAGQPCNFTIVTKDAGAGQQINFDSDLLLKLSRLDSPPQPLLNSSLSSSPLSSSITSSLFHSRLKTYFFNKSFPP